MSPRPKPETPRGRIGGRIHDRIGEPNSERGDGEPSGGKSQGSRRLPEHREEDTQAPAAGELRPLARALVALSRALMEDNREEGQ